MNPHIIQLLFLKDLFLARRALFGYLLAAIVSTGIVSIPHPIIAFAGQILIATVAIASGIHLIGNLLLSERIDQTKTFIMSFPVSLRDYSIAKIGVMLTTFLIPWSTMLALITIGCFVIPEGKPGVIALLFLLFFFLLCAYLVQVLTAVITESIGWTVSVMVLCNILFNLFAKSLSDHPVMIESAKSEVITWPPLALQIFAIQVVILVACVGAAFIIQSRERDLI